MQPFHANIIKNIAQEAGFDICGIVADSKFDAERTFFESWLDNGYAAGLEYLHKNIDKRFSIENLVPGTKSVICCAVSYKNDTSTGHGNNPDTPKVASYARAATYQETIKGMLREMASRLEEHYGKFSWRAFSDTAPVLEKRWAAEAGLGFIGRNRLLISPIYGSFILLGELVIDVPVDIYDSPYEGAGCGNCQRCVTSCPSGAITTNGIDTRRCISRLTIEKNDPEEHSNALNGWIFGCDECQSSCPYNERAPLYTNDRFAPLFNPADMDDNAWLALSPDDFSSLFARTPLARAGYDKIQHAVRLRQQYSTKTK